MKRVDLLNTLKLASPALLSDNEVVLPVLKSFKFANDHVIASNDVISACLAVGEIEEAIVPGKKLVSFLSACGTKLVKFTPSKKGVIVKCGTSKLSLESLPEDEWPFEFPDIEHARSITVNDKFFTGLELCSSQSADTGLGSWLGGIIMLLGTSIRMYGVGRDRVTISHFRVKGIKSEETKVKKICVPSSFCKSAVPMSKEFGTEATLHVTDDSVVLDWGEGENILATKLISADMPNVVGKFKETTEEELEFIPITKTLTSALKRAATIGDEGTCNVNTEEGGLHFYARSSDGASLSDLVKVDKIGNIEAKIAAGLILKQLGNCSEICFGENSTTLRSESGEFIYIISNRADEEGEEE